MSVIETINEAAKLIDDLAVDLYQWKSAYANQGTPEGNEETAQLIEKAYEVSKKLRGEDA